MNKIFIKKFKNEQRINRYLFCMMDHHMQMVIFIWGMH